MRPDTTTADSLAGAAPIGGNVDVSWSSYPPPIAGVN